MNTYAAIRPSPSFTGGILPMPYDPRHLIVRQMLSPITDTTDVQASINTVQMGVHQRLQTKRGPIGRRRIVDYMTLDAIDHLFSHGQSRQFRHALGPGHVQLPVVPRRPDEHRLSGWFDFFKLVGSTPLASVTGYNPNGLNIITTGISIARPPRSNVFLGYSIIDTGPDQDLGPQRLDELLVEPEVVWYLFANRTTSATRFRWERCLRSHGSGPIT